MSAFGELVRQSGLLPADRLDFALDEQKRTGFRLAQILVDHGLTEETDLFRAVARVSGRQRLDMNTAQVDIDVARAVDAEWAIEYRMVPLFIDEWNKSVSVATSDPTQSGLLAEVGARVGASPTPVIATESEVGRLIRHAYFNEPLDRTRGGSTVPSALSERASGPKASDPSRAPTTTGRRQGRRSAAAGRSLPPFPAWPTVPDLPTSPDLQTSPDLDELTAPAHAEQVFEPPDEAKTQVTQRPKGLAYPTRTAESELPTPPPADKPNPRDYSTVTLTSRADLPVLEGPLSPPASAPLSPLLNTPLSAVDGPLLNLPLSSVNGPAPNLPLSPPLNTPMAPTRPAATADTPLAHPASPSQDLNLAALAPVVEMHEYTAAAIEAIFELCLARGIITREEYLSRLGSHDLPRGSRW